MMNDGQIAPLPALSLGWLPCCASVFVAFGASSTA